LRINPPFFSCFFIPSFGQEPFQDIAKMFFFKWGKSCIFWEKIMYPLAIIGDQLMVQRWIHPRKSDKLRGAARSGMMKIPYNDFFSISYYKLCISL